MSGDRHCRGIGENESARPLWGRRVDIEIQILHVRSYRLVNYDDLVRRTRFPI